MSEEKGNKAVIRAVSWMTLGAAIALGAHLWERRIFQQVTTYVRAQLALVQLEGRENADETSN